MLRQLLSIGADLSHKAVLNCARPLSVQSGAARLSSQAGRVVSRGNLMQYAQHSIRGCGASHASCRMSINANLLSAQHVRSLSSVRCSSAEPDTSHSLSCRSVRLSRQFFSRPAFARHRRTADATGCSKLLRGQHLRFVHSPGHFLHSGRQNHHSRQTPMCAARAFGFWHSRDTAAEEDRCCPVQGCPNQRQLVHVWPTVSEPSHTLSHANCKNN